MLAAAWKEDSASIDATVRFKGFELEIRLSILKATKPDGTVLYDTIEIAIDPSVLLEEQ